MRLSPRPDSSSPNGRVLTVGERRTRSLLAQRRTIKAKGRRHGRPGSCATAQQQRGVNVSSARSPAAPLARRSAPPGRDRRLHWHLIRRTHIAHRPQRMFALARTVCNAEVGPRRRSQPKARFAGHGSRTHRGRSSSVGSAATRCTRGNRCTRMRRALVRAARASAVGQPICMTSPRHAHMDLKFPRLSNFRNIENLGSRAAPGRNEGRNNQRSPSLGVSANPLLCVVSLCCSRASHRSCRPFLPDSLEGQPTNLPFSHGSSGDPRES